MVGAKFNRRHVTVIAQETVTTAAHRKQEQREDRCLCSCFQREERRCEKWRGSPAILCGLFAFPRLQPFTIESCEGDELIAAVRDTLQQSPVGRPTIAQRFIAGTTG